MIVFSPAPRCKPGVQRLVEPMTAACYLRLRRARSGMSRRDLAYRLSSAVQPHYLVSPAARVPALDEAMALIDMLETDGARARYRWTIEAISALIPVDVDVYHQLASDPEERHPQVCRGCACTEGDVASSGWAVANLCVSCLKRDAALAEVR
ncbi:hypothetical protein [Sphingomonas sp. 8AM]|uniref:hypothetical protein n=1 Tax=Sphingomonas sp. 8AM TaxID=2653170 RepID=UPI0012F3EAFE|nr:hypothetical protein [Sphingomonas sp. 8AM]VXC80137.1 conserved hypothetical protein [Sphingomonas sp. 8AM]